MPRSARCSGRLPALALALTGLVAVGAAGCRWNPSVDGIPRGELGAREVVEDFGWVFSGYSASRTIEIRNVGAGPLVLQFLERSSGTDVSIGGVPTGASPAFEVSFVEGQELAATGTVLLEVTYRPPASGESQVDHETVLLLHAGNTRAGEDTATITLKGRTASGVCVLPTGLDFGRVQRGDVGELALILRNPTKVPMQASIGEVRSDTGDHAAFTFADVSSSGGTVDLAPGEQRPLAISFRPTEAKAYRASVVMRSAEGCPDLNLELVGEGVDQVLSWNPRTLDGQHLRVGTSAVHELQFRNDGAREVVLTELLVTPSDEFGIVAVPGTEVTRLVVPPATRDAWSGEWRPGWASVRVFFRPAATGAREGALTFRTNLALKPEGNIRLRCVGVGPDIQLLPAGTLDFGKVAYFEGGQPAQLQLRRFTIRNEGITSPQPDAESNLRLGTITVTPLNADTVPSEFTVILPSDYDAASGLVAAAGRNMIRPAVRLAPQSVGSKRARVEIASNDPDEPIVELIVTAEVVALPPCDYAVTRWRLSFGVIAPPDHRDLSFTVTNLGTGPGDVCLISGLDFEPGSNPAFVLPQGPISSEELAPGESREIVVRAAPEGPVQAGLLTALGTLRFYLSSPNRPIVTVHLDASVGTSCLTVAPNAVEFGTVAPGCGSGTRMLRLYNTCPGQLTITGISTEWAAGGVPAAPEFALVQAPSLPWKLSPGLAPQTISLAYRPVDAGADRGKLVIRTFSEGMLLIPLSGQGDPAGLHTDVFVQDSAPKRDVLVTLDNSGSMQEEQLGLGQGFGEFIQQAATEQVSYHVAVTTMDNDPGGARGRFLSGAEHPETVLSPGVANVESKFMAKVNVGTSGSDAEMCFETSLKALTAPLITAENAGFLRPDAPLSVICISDEDEQSPEPVSSYLDRLLNVKGHHRKGLFTFNAIAGLTPGCPGDTGAYAQTAQATGGFTEDICTPDWGATLRRVGEAVFGPQTRFFLTSQPDRSRGNLEVTIDHQPISNVAPDGTTAWSFDQASSSITFARAHTPRPGETLRVTYPVYCLP